MARGAQLCADLDEGMGETPEGGDIRTLMADLLYCTAETSTTL